MKILYVSTRSDTIGGSNIHIRDLAVAFQKRGLTVLVAGGQDGVFADDLRSNGIDYLPLRHLTRNVRPHRDVAAILELRSVIRRIKPDIVSLHTAKAGAVGRVAGLGLGIPVLYTPHGWTFTAGIPPLEAFIYAFVERILAPGADRIINVCETDRELALSRHVGHIKQHRTIHNGMPEAAPEFMSYPAETPVRLGMVARFEQPKDHETLIHALSQCMDLPWTLEFIGPGPQQQYIEELVARLGMADRVSFLGFRADIPEVLAEQQIFVLISRWEGFPRSILEAMRAGLPVVASNVGGVREAVAHEINGYVVESGNLNGLASYLRRLITDPGLRARMGAEGRKRYEDSFTFDRMLEQTLEQYQESLESAGTQAS